MKRILVLALSSSLIFTAAYAKGKIAKTGSLVKVEYVGKVDDGIIFDTNLKQAPLEFVIGDGTVLKGFEDGVIGLKAGDKTTISIPADYAYGPEDSAKLFQLPRAQVPADMPIEEGANIVLQGPQGSILARVVEINDTDIYIDTNHLLAAKDLTFEVKVLAVEKIKKKA